MSLAAAWGTGQVLWSILWLFFFVMWIWLIAVIFADVVHSNDLSGWGKATWLLCVVALPYLGFFAYLVVRGDGMTARRGAHTRLPG